MSVTMKTRKPPTLRCKLSAAAAHRRPEGGVTHGSFGRELGTKKVIEALSTVALATELRPTKSFQLREGDRHVRLHGGVTQKRGERSVPCSWRFVQEKDQVEH